jgi:hypothetical protein
MNPETTLLVRQFSFSKWVDLIREILQESQSIEGHMYWRWMPAQLIQFLMAPKTHPTIKHSLKYRIIEQIASEALPKS